MNPSHGRARPPSGTRLPAPASGAAPAEAVANDNRLGSAGLDGRLLTLRLALRHVAAEPVGHVVLLAACAVLLMFASLSTGELGVPVLGRVRLVLLVHGVPPAAVSTRGAYAGVRQFPRLRHVLIGVAHCLRPTLRKLPAPALPSPEGAPMIR